MEEWVGALWHRIVTRAAENRYPEAAVTLADFGKGAGTLFRALGGDSGLSVTGGHATRHGARRRWLQRIAGSGERVSLARRDADHLCLPPAIDLFPDRRLNRDLYLWLLALAGRDPGPALPWFARSQAAAAEALARYPGMVPRYRRLVEACIALRPGPAGLPPEEAAQERAIRAALEAPGSVALFPAARRPHHPVHLWFQPGADAGRPAPVAAPEPEEGEQGGSNPQDRDGRKRAAERVDMPDGRNGFMMVFRAESLFSWAEFIRVNRPTDEDENPAARDAAEDLDVMSVARGGKAVASRLRFDLDLPAASEDDLPLGEGVPLPEWDCRKQALLPDWCRLQPMVARAAGDAPLPQKLVSAARRLRRQFEALAATRSWVKGQPFGSELDVDAWVRYAGDRRTGRDPGECGFYKSMERRDRSLACLLLADLSLSTDAWVSDEARVIDVIRDSLYLFGEAMAGTGDRFALFGFSSVKRSHVRFHVLKGFRERWGGEVRGRLAALKPGFYTRMGAAIRHSTALLAREPAHRRLLLILTDGKPNDLDRYEGRYGIEDTRMAVLEARRAGLQPFCVTIDREAGEYLPHLFGSKGYVVIRNPLELPKRLPALYAEMTR